MLAVYFLGSISPQVIGIHNHVLIFAIQLIGPWEILMKLNISNFQVDFSD